MELMKCDADNLKGKDRVGKIIGCCQVTKGIYKRVNVRGFLCVEALRKIFYYFADFFSFSRSQMHSSEIAIGLLKVSKDLVEWFHKCTSIPHIPRLECRAKPIT